MESAFDSSAGEVGPKEQRTKRLPSANLEKSHTRAPIGLKQDPKGKTSAFADKKNAIPPSTLMKSTSSTALNTQRRPSVKNIENLYKPKDKKEPFVNHTIRRTTNQGSQIGSLAEEAGQMKGSRPMRRLSRITLGRNLTLSSAAGLKLQWTVVDN